MPAITPSFSVTCAGGKLIATRVKKRKPDADYLYAVRRLHWKRCPPFQRACQEGDALNTDLEWIIIKSIAIGFADCAIPLKRITILLFYCCSIPIFSSLRWGGIYFISLSYLLTAFASLLHTPLSPFTFQHSRRALL